MVRRIAPKSFFLFLPLLLFFSCGESIWQGRNLLPPAGELETQARAVLEAAGAEQYYREVIYLGEQTQFLSFTTKDKQILFSLELRVSAGMDLSFPLSIETQGWSEIHISLPPPKILSIDADEHTLNQYFIRERGSHFTRMEYYDAILLAKDRVRQEAVQRGILEKASANVRLLLTGLFQAAGFKSVTFTEAKNLLESNR